MSRSVEKARKIRDTTPIFSHPDMDKLRESMNDFIKTMEKILSNANNFYEYTNKKYNIWRLLFVFFSSDLRLKELKERI